MPAAMTELKVGGHPEFLEAQRFLLSHQVPVARVVRVFSAGDYLASTSDGVPVPTILFIDGDGLPRTALITSDGTDRGMVELCDGWPVDA